MSGLAYYCVDLETSGLRSKYHEVFEISIIRATDRMQLCKNIRCEFPERSSYDALQVTGKTLVDLEQGLTREKVVDECEKFFAEDGLTPAHRCIVGHNIYTFDRKFLHALWESVGKEFPAHLWMDTIPMIKCYAKQIGLVKPRVNLHAACDIAGIKKFAQAHSAKIDSRNSYLLWKNLVEDKKMDHLNFIKTAAHTIAPNGDEPLNIDSLDVE